MLIVYAYHYGTQDLEGTSPDPYQIMNQIRVHTQIFRVRSLCDQIIGGPLH